MATSQGVNVLRWSALVFGVFYGFSHQNAIYSRDKVTATQHEWERKQQLIDQAKAEWKKRQDPSSQKSGVVSDPEDPKFDLEAYLNDVHARHGSGQTGPERDGAKYPSKDASVS